MSVRNGPQIILLHAVLIAVVGAPSSHCVASAQQSRPPMKTFWGPNDSAFPYPAQEGTSGQKDPAALAEIKASVAASLLPEHTGLEVTGILTSGFGNNQQQYPVSFAVDSGSRFRLDIQKRNGIYSTRIDGRAGRFSQNDKAPQSLEDIEFVNPLALPELLLELANRKDAAVIDDGSLVVDEESLKKVTITLFQTRYGTPTSASFYFDSASNLLAKGAFVGHSAGNRSLRYLKVMTYGDYRKDQSVLLPHKYSETIGGQLTMSVKVTNTSITPSHDKAYFAF